MTTKTARTLAVFLIALCGTLIPFFLCHYLEQQQALLLEGNQLHSSEAMQIKGIAPSEAIRILGELGPEARMLATYDDANNILIVAANDYSSLPFPLYEGLGLANDANHEALAGSTAPVVSSEGRGSITLHDVSFTVTGRLGTSALSPLQHLVVVKYQGSLDASRLTSLIVDGPGAAKKLAALCPTATIEPVDNGIAHRLLLDTTTPLLLASGIVGTVLALSCAGYHFALLKQEETTVLRIKGARMKHLIAHASIRLTAIAVTAFLIPAIGCSILSRGLPITHLSAILALGIIAPNAIFIASITHLQRTPR